MHNKQRFACAAADDVQSGGRLNKSKVFRTNLSVSGCPVAVKGEGRSTRRRLQWKGSGNIKLERRRPGHNGLGSGWTGLCVGPLGHITNFVGH